MTWQIPLRWEVRYASVGSPDCSKLLGSGWEPFAATGDGRPVIVLRKMVAVDGGREAGQEVRGEQPSVQSDRSVDELVADVIAGQHERSRAIADDDRVRFLTATDLCDGALAELARRAKLSDRAFARDRLDPDRRTP